MRRTAVGTSLGRMSVLGMVAENRGRSVPPREPLWRAMLGVFLATWRRR